ncbi:MAG: TetR/AcrR family transcriptional regulator [Dehalococcoidia bacterium]|nr:TetR/AcrR family transcriptional regulator [Dehalococcoidia bacterium]
MRNRPGTRTGTATRILDVAERLAETRGYNGFSYADVAVEVGVTKASLHYHFPSKAELGRTLLERYTRRFMSELEGIAALEASSVHKLHQYVEIYSEALREERMCLCGIFTAEWATLPESMQAAIRRFFALNETWLTALLEAGRAEGAFVFESHPSDLASVVTSALEGALLLARTGAEPARFTAVTSQLLRTIVPAE